MTHDEAEHREARAERIVGVIIGTLIVLPIVLGMSTCVQRNWQFEDECRRQGGYVTRTLRVGNASDDGRDACIRVMQPQVSQIVPVPNYRK